MRNSRGAYQQLCETGGLRLRTEKVKALLSCCKLCPHECGVNRLAGEVGKCRTGSQAVVSSHGPHFGEEPPLVGRHGSGTIFFTHCNLRCLFCQNYTISQLGEGALTTPEELAEMMLSLQDRGCHNINLVTPTHVVFPILQALELAAARGLSIPLVYNSGGYDRLETLQILDGIIDIYMPDMKYSDEHIAEQLSGIKNYPSVNQAAVKEMHRQVGDLQIDEAGIATRGLLVRHLVLPHRLAGTEEVVRFLAKEVSPHTYVNIMAQYHPGYEAFQHKLLSQPLSRQEFMEAVDLAHKQGLERIEGLQPLRVRLFL